MYKSFEDAEKKYYELWYSDNADQIKAIEIAEYCLRTYSEHKNQIIMDLIVFYGESNNIVKCKEMLNLGFENDIWYPKEFFEKFWNNENYKDQVDRWEELRDLSLKNAKVKYEIQLPSNYDKSKEYPLFISLHGWGEDLNLFKFFWKSDSIKSKFIHVFIQSSQMVGAYHYAWSDRDASIKDIKSLLSKVKNQYKVSNTLILGGFSEGASTSIDLAFSLKDINASAFIALNPNRPDNLTSESIASYKNSKIRGAIITGDQDQCFNSQNEMIADFKSNNIKCNFHISKNFGHWFPDDLSKLIDDAIEFVL